MVTGEKPIKSRGSSSPFPPGSIVSKTAGSLYVIKLICSCLQSWSPSKAKNSRSDFGSVPGITAKSRSCEEGRGEQGFVRGLIKHDQQILDEMNGDLVGYVPSPDVFHQTVLISEA